MRANAPGGARPNVSIERARSAKVQRRARELRCSARVGAEPARSAKSIKTNGR
jgi:hypothetical protein